MYNSLVWNKQTNLDILDFFLTHKSFISFFVFGIILLSFTASASIS